VARENGDLTDPAAWKLVVNKQTGRWGLTYNPPMGPEPGGSAWAGYALNPTTSMRVLDWVVLCATLACVALYGLWRGRGRQNVDSYMLAGRAMPWYAVAFSVMATQASAVTFISTTGQSYVDGLRFVQFYFGLPFAMVILSFTAVPLFHRARVFTAYEYLEKRFDVRTRVLVSLIFLIQRGLALGITLYAPAVVLTVILGWPDGYTTLIVGGIAVAFTTLGGVKATSWSHMPQMAVMTLGLLAALICAVLLLPPHVSFGDAVTVAGVAGRLNAITTTFDWNDRYNLWSGLFGGMFLALAYFGTDQSQVQRYLTGRSIGQSRLGLMFNAVAKIPMQFFILFIGVMVFVFYIYEKPPILFQPTQMERLQSPELREPYQRIAERYQAAFEDRKRAADHVVAAGRRDDEADAQRAREAYGRAQQAIDLARKDAGGLLERVDGQKVNDTNYIFLTFVTRYLPAGLVGLVLAVILGATSASISSEMNALATVSVIDIYKRLARGQASEDHYVWASRVATVLWGGYAVVSAQYVKRMGSLIEAVNLLGSFFYGGMLGVFVLAFFAKRVGGRGAFYGVLAGEAVIFACWYFTSIAYLWYNVIGCVVVVVTGLLVSGLERRNSPAVPDAKQAGDWKGHEH
jgi:Na+/proline symporter